MAATEIKRNHETRHCIFAIDDKTDISMLPTSEKNGTGDLKFSTPCCQGSIAKANDGKSYRLSGNNEWEEYSVVQQTDIVAVTDAEIEALFA